MKEEKPKNCKALITTRDTTMQPNPPLPHSISITTMPQPKIKIKLPKLLIKTILRRRNHKCNDTNNGGQNKPKSRWAKPKRFFPKKLSSIIHNVFGNKNSKHMCSCSGGNNSVHCRVRCKKTDTNGDQSESRSLKEIFEIEGEMGMQESFKQLNGKINRTTNNCDSCCSNSSNGGVSAMGKHESSSMFYRAPSRRVNGYRQIRRVRSTRKKVNKQVEEEDEEDDEGEELCKKRILMGERCKPLHVSGTLKYDKNGILLPELLPCEEL